jgi:hypothetical protein
LLTAPIEAHGGAKQAIFSDRQQAQYAQLVRWAHQVSGSAAPTVEPTLAERTAPLAEHGPQVTTPPNLAVPPTGAEPGTTAPASIDGAAGNDAAMARAQAAALAEHGTGPAAGGKKTPAADYVPKDPFDPEVFNRLYHGR